MWKIALLFVVAAFSLASAQEPITLNCTFSVDWYNKYVCRLSQIEVLDSSRNVVIGGEHLGNRTNGDVEVVDIRNSSTPFMIQQIFTTFPNITELDIQNSRLESINIPDNIQLEILILTGNNISRIVNGTFRAQSRLQVLSAIRAGVHVIEEDAFVGLESLESLILIGNSISDISTRILSPLINATRIDFERNNLTRINDIFSSNTNLTNLYLEYNQINEISPRFIANLGDSLFTVNLRGNRCVDRYFFLDEEIDLIIFNNALSSCFNNFNGNVSETRRITLEFQGPLALFDEFGNILARIN